MDVPLIVRREVQIAAPPATVFAFLTDPDKILRWIGTEATVEPHPGGLYLLKVGRQGRARALHARSSRSTASPTASAGRATQRCRRDRAWSRST